MNNVKQALMWVVLSGSLTFYFRALSCVCVCVCICQEEEESWYAHPLVNEWAHG